MGIGVNYIGSGGGRKAFELDGVPEAGSMAAGILGASVANPQFLGGGSFAPLLAAPEYHGGSQIPIPQMLEVPSMSDDADKGKVKLNEGDRPDYLERKISPNGSLSVLGNQLMLRGDESCGGGRRMYGALGGQRGFFTFQQYDPGGGGIMCSGAGDTADGSEATLNGMNGGATMRVGGRSYVYTDMTVKDAPALVVKEFYRLARVTPNGRIVSVSKEYEQVLLRHPLGGGGKYGVRPFWLDTDTDKPTLAMLAFGTEADLDTWDGEKFTANDNPKVDEETGETIYPVKMVGVSACTNGTKGGKKV